MFVSTSFTECLCQDEGSLSCECTETEGICHCKDNIEGDKCDQCKPSYWNYPSCHGKHKYGLPSLHKIIIVYKK